ncbi:MAG: sodium:solute symporter, partial [Bryobacteraceae bacterium]
IVRVNIVGSLFYGSLLGVFVLAFLFRGVGGNAAFWGVLVGEAGVLVVAASTQVSFLWYNVVGCLLVVGVGLALSRVRPSGKDAAQLDNRSGMR